MFSRTRAIFRWTDVSVDVRLGIVRVLFGEGGVGVNVRLLVVVLLLRDDIGMLLVQFPAQLGDDAMQLGDALFIPLRSPLRIVLRVDFLQLDTKLSEGKYSEYIRLNSKFHACFLALFSRETVVKQRVANSEGGGKACHDWCEAKTAPWPVHKDRWSRDSAAL